MTINRYSPIKDYIKSQEPEKILATFNDNLTTFIRECSIIRKQWNSTPSSNEKARDKLMMDYVENWGQFVAQNAFYPILKYRDKEKRIGIDITRDLIRGEDLVNAVAVNKWLTAVAEYTVYIFRHEGLGDCREWMIWQVLFLARQKVAANVMLDPVVAIRELDKAIRNYQEDAPAPSASCYLGETYSPRLSSSQKAHIYRQKKLTTYLAEWLFDFKKRNGRNPTRGEVRRYLVFRCQNSDDPRLRIFTTEKSITPKTLNRLTKDINSLISRKKREKAKKNNIDFNNEMKEATSRLTEKKITEPSVSKNPEERKMTLDEVYKFLDEGTKRIFKEAL